MGDRVIVCGLGKVGYSVLQLLHTLRVPAVVVTTDIAPDWMAQARALAQRVIWADARQEATLLDAGVTDARAVIIATPHDLVNLEIVLEVHRLAPGVPVVLRMYDAQLSERAKRDLPVQAVLNAATLSAPAFVAAALGDSFVRAFNVGGAFVLIEEEIVSDRIPGMLGRSIQEWADRAGVVPLGLVASPMDGESRLASKHPLEAGDRVAYARVQAPHGPGKDLAGQSHRARRHRPGSVLHLRARARLWRHSLKVLRSTLRSATPALRWAAGLVLFVSAVAVCVFHGALGLSWVDAVYFTVATVTTVGYGDIVLLSAPAWLKLFGTFVMLSGASMMVILYSLVTDLIVRQRVMELMARHDPVLRDHVVVVGLGNLGAGVAERLAKLGVGVVAVEKREREGGAAPVPVDVHVVHGDAMVASVMETAGISRARAVLAVTDDDLTNLRVVHRAQEMSSRPRTVARLFNLSLSEKLGKGTLGADVMLNPSELAAATFVAAALAPGVLQGFTLGRRLILLRQMSVTSESPVAGLDAHQARESCGFQVVLRRAQGASGFRAVEPSEPIREGESLVLIEEYDRDSQLCRACEAVMTAPHQAGSHDRM